MKCCGTELPKPAPVVMYEYHCPKCNVIHWVNAREVEEILVGLHARIDELERQATNGRPLPDLF
jgi:hypothetical protein